MLQKTLMSSYSMFEDLGKLTIIRNNTHISAFERF